MVLSWAHNQSHQIIFCHRRCPDSYAPGFKVCGLFPTPICLTLGIFWFHFCCCYFHCFLVKLQLSCVSNNKHPMTWPLQAASHFRCCVITLFHLIAWELLRFIDEASGLHPWTLRSVFLLVYSTSILSSLLSWTPLLGRDLLHLSLQRLLKIS